jgi:drug/metabolite transporter (DMT)-like permease
MVDDEFRSRASRAKWASVFSLVLGVASLAVGILGISGSPNASSGIVKLLIIGVVALIASVLCVVDMFRIGKARKRVQAAVDREWAA